ncbi:hypothetical protein BD626DRAFT_573057 [Schizophyllum amplum]|uniref:F-box domain-containing protein n=1 Tax=Schizophyllum amplum TaxID=97359 RepID=A0A550C2K5_9AGAR|nr:hypothetical protein BD626DRAFT_573057 [Auriculariopsis ampla]
MPKKRRKTIAVTPAVQDDVSVAKQLSRPRKRKGKLHKITELPLDVFFEILRHCAPVDLLRISYANKTLRSILLCSSSKWIWQHSFGAFPTAIPACPNNRLILPQYANLIFGNSCFQCGSKGGKYALWAALERVCPECLKKK